MRSGKHGQHTSAEASNVTSTGFWLLIADKERFLPFKEFPWFKEARIRELMNVELQSPNHLYWPDLDVDLSVESIDDPERFPLVSRVRSKTTLQPPSRTQRKSKAQRGSRVARG